VGRCFSLADLFCCVTWN